MSAVLQDRTPDPADPALEPPPLGIGLLGCGVVGSAVARALVRDAGRLEAATGRCPEIRAVAVRDLEKPRDVPPGLTFTDDPASLILRDDVDVVIEAIGGVNPAGGLLEGALLTGKDVVTANKELLSRRWTCLREVARGAERALRFEGAVMAGVPVLDPLAALAASDRVLAFEGLLNGTTNYCLHRMEEAGLSLGEAVSEAQRLGYAELDPTSDIEGRDAAAKVAILASLAFGEEVRLADVAFAGIEGIAPKDLAEARARDESIRLVGGAYRVDGEIVAEVAPRVLPSDHPLVAIRDHHNGVFVETELAGPLLFQGPGAGGDATASAVVRDLVGAVRSLPAR